MICDPAIVELMGFESEDDYPFPVGSSTAAPERVYCESTEPVITPHGTFQAIHSAYDAELVQAAPSAVLETFGYRFRLFYAAPSSNQADAINLENTSSYPMSAMAFVTSSTTVDWREADADPTDNGWIAKMGITVMETVIGGTPLAPYSSVYGAYRSSPVTPSLEVTHSWDGTWDKRETLNAWAYGVLPQLAPGSAYRLEPFMFIKASTLILRSTAVEGTYANGRMYFGAVGWSDTS